MIHYKVVCPKCEHEEPLDEDMSCNAEFLSDDEVIQYRRGYCRACGTYIEYTIHFHLGLDYCEGEVTDAYECD